MIHYNLFDRSTGLRLFVSLIVALLALTNGRAEDFDVHDGHQKKLKGEIIVSLIDEPGQFAGYESLIKKYNEYQPDVNVQLEIKGGSFGAGYDTWLNTQLSSGNPRPDIVSSNYSMLYGGYVNFDYYRKVVNPYTGEPWENHYNFDFFSFRDANGRRIMLPTQSVGALWFYNKSIFEDLGLTPPQTWPEFMSICEKIRASGTIPISLKFDYRFHQWMSEILWDQYSRPYIKHMRALPGDWCYDPVIDGKWEYDPMDPYNDARLTINKARRLKAFRDGIIRYDTPEFMMFLENLKALAQHTPDDFLLPPTGEQSAAYTIFLRQEAAMHIDNTMLLSLIKRDMEDIDNQSGSGSKALSRFEWGVFSTPPQVNPLVKAPVRSVESASGEYIGIIHKNQPRTDIAIDFVMFWLSPVGYQAFVDGQVQAGEFVPAGPIQIQDIEIPPLYEELFELLEPMGNAENDSVNVIFNYPILGSRSYQDSYQLLTRYLQDKITTEEMAEQFQELIERATDEIIEIYDMEYIVNHPEVNPN